MTAYELMISTNHHIIKGVTFTETQKKDIVNQLLAAKSTSEEAQRFYRGVKCPNNLDNEGRRMYPSFYIPPYNNRNKYRLITGQLPKTHIFSANHYELEILRVLGLWGSDISKVKSMMEETIKRLDTTCFAHFCPTGECVGAGISVLRFLSLFAPQHDKWINALLTPIIDRYNNGHKGMAATNNNVPVFYLYSVLPDIANESCFHLVESRKDWIIHILTRGGITGPAIQDTYNVLLLYVLRNALAMLPAYAYMKNREVYISEKDNRCYCDV